MKKVLILCLVLISLAGYSQCETFNMIPCKPKSLVGVEPTDQSSTVYLKHGEFYDFPVEIIKGKAYDLVVCYDQISTNGMHLRVKDVDTNVLLHTNISTNGSSLIQFRGGKSQNVNVTVHLSELPGAKPSGACVGLAVYEIN